ncbi:MAG: tetratricopeptide repeat protein [Phycisphaerae bacterium]
MPGAGASQPALPERARVSLDALPPPPATLASNPSQAKLTGPVLLAIVEAERYIGKNQFAQAIARLQEVLDQAPDNPRLRKAMGLAYTGLGDAPHAIENFRAAARFAGDDLPLQVLLGHLLAGQGQGDEAIAALRVALKCTAAKSKDPTTAEALLSLAEVLEQQGYLAASLECYTTLYDWTGRYGREYSQRQRLRPLVVQSEILLLRRGRLLLELGRLKEAEQVLRQARSRNQSDSEPVELLMRALLAGKDFPAAEKLLLEVAGNPEDQTLPARMAELLCDSARDRTMPMRLWTSIQKKNGANGPLAVALAKSARKMRATADAAAIMDSVLAKMPGDVTASLFVADLDVQEGRGVQALRRLARLLEANHDAAPAVKQAIAQLSAAGRLSAGVESEFVQAAGEESKATSQSRPAPSFEASLLYVAGQLALAKSQHGTALEMFDRSVRADARFIPSYEALVDLALSREAFDRAQAVAQQLGKAAGSDEKVKAYALYLEGRSLLAQGEIRSAAELLQQASELDERHLPTLLLLGEAFTRLSRHGEAIGVLGEAIRLSPQRADLYRRLFDLCVMARKYDQAEAVVARSLQAAGGSAASQAMAAELLILTKRRDEGMRVLAQLRQRSGDDPAVQILALRVELESTAGVMTKAAFDTAVQKIGGFLSIPELNIQARLLLAELLSRTGQDAQASVVLASLYEETGGISHVARAYAAALAKSRQYATAAAVLESLPAEEAEDAAIRQVLLEMLGKQGRIDLAAEKLASWLAKPTDANAANVQRAQLLEIFGQTRSYAVALKFVDEWLARPKLEGDLQAKLQAARVRLLCQAGEVKQAIVYAGRLAEKAPTPLDVKLQLISALAEANQYAQAQELLNEWGQRKPQPTSATTRASATSSRSATATSAASASVLDDVRKVLSSAELSVLWETKLALLIREGRMDQAREVVDRWLASQRAAIGPRQLLVMAMIGAGQQDEALKRVDQWMVDLARPARRARDKDRQPATRRARAVATSRTTALAVLPVTRAAATMTATSAPHASSAPASATSAASATSTAMSGAATTSAPASAQAQWPEPPFPTQELDPNAAIRWCRETAVQILMMQQKTDQALARCREYLVADGENPQLLSTLSSLLGEMGKEQEALAALEKAVALGKDDPGLANNLAYLYADQGVHLKKAESLIHQAISARPESPAIIDTLGWVLYKQGRVAEAAMVLDRGLQAGKANAGEQATFLYHAGDAYYRLGWKDQAVERWTKALELTRQEKVINSDMRQILRQVPLKVLAVEVGQEPPLAPIGETR